MEKGSIDQPVAQRAVVIMVPTLVLQGVVRRYANLLSPRQRVQRRVDASHINTAMIAWMERIAFSHNTSFEVWYLATDSDAEKRYFDLIVERCSPYVHRSVSYWGHYDEETAVEILKGTQFLSTVYDSDHGRLDRCWHMRGYRVPFGGTP